VTANAVRRLRQHYVDNFRRLPWRSGPGEGAPDPYRVWLSEVMLQQTTVSTVVPRFERFVARWPTVRALAAARDEDVLAEWAGLGYYARARNLIASAREVAERGAFPSTAAELRQLPGIGDYTAGAIAAIAFGERAPAVDTNVARVIDRLHALPSAGRREVERLMLELMPADHPGDFVQAMMDLGATICRPKSPSCDICPLNADCRAAATGNPTAFPEARERRPRPHKHGIAYWTERDGSVWLVRRPAKGLLGGMSALPCSDWERGGDVPASAIGTVRHVFTHFSLDLHIVSAPSPVGQGWWQPLARLHETGLPTLYQRAAELVLNARRAA
jgi:A/G-specific adenine glycosylase